MAFMNISETETSWKRLLFRFAKAALAAAATGIMWLLIWVFTSTFSANYPQYSALFEVFAWAMILFTFIITLSENTIYKYIFIVVRAFFTMIYIAYATDFGLLSFTGNGFSITVESMPLVALIVLANLLEITRGLLQAVEFASQSPKD